ncbi:hypothetical protein Q3G72_020998 [Acer saccharum]|nr:hypothetical protein Q3G72_020998 [Acer saccharum]
MPSRLLHLEAHHCISLETFPTSNVVFTGNWNSKQKFKYSNCFNLDENARTNIMADARLRSQFMANNAWGTASTDDYPVKRRLLSSLSICLPGSEIPEWIEEQDEGSSVIMIDLPPNCEFFVEWICEFIDEDEESHEVLCHVDNVTVGHPNSDHVFLVTSNRDLFDVQGGGGDDDDNGEGSSSIKNFSFSSCKEAYFRFSLLDTELCPLLNCEVTKCGVHLLYSEDVESTKSTHDGIDSSGDQVELVVGSGRDGGEEAEDPNFEPQVEHLNCSLFNCFSFLFQFEIRIICNAIAFYWI